MVLKPALSADWINKFPFGFRFPFARELQLNFKGCLYDFFRAPHNGWRGFCQDF